MQQVTHNNNNKERRRFFRMPLNVPLCLKTGPVGSVIDVVSSDLNPYGVQIQSGGPVKHNELVELWPEHEGPQTDYAVKGQIRWVKPDDGKFRSGIAFDKVVDWSIPMSEITKGFDSITYLNYFQDVLDTLDDGILVVDSKFNIVDANIKQPFCLPQSPEKLKGKNLADVSLLFKDSDKEDHLKELLHRALAGEKKLKIRSYLNEFPSIEGADDSKYWNIFLSPLIQPNGKRCVILRGRDITALRRLQDEENAREETFWLQYKHIILGQQLDQLLEDIVNPISAVVGRLDLMVLKISDTKVLPDKAQLKIWKSDLESIQSIMGHITELCRATAHRRDKETAKFSTQFSLNSMIEDRDMAQRLSIEAKERFHKCFTIDHMLDETEAWLYDCVRLAKLK